MSLQDARRRQRFGTAGGGQFERIKEADLYKLGTEKRPAMLVVTSEQRKSELQKICDENNWLCEIEVDKEGDEDIADLEELQNPPEPAKSEKVAGRNDPCPCGSGKKYKHCHGKK